MPRDAVKGELNTDRNGSKAESREKRMLRLPIVSETRPLVRDGWSLRVSSSVAEGLSMVDGEVRQGGEKGAIRQRPRETRS